MHRLKALIEHIDDELDGAEEYVECAEKWKADGRSDVSYAFCKMAQTELDHATTLLDITESYVAEHKKAHPSDTGAEMLFGYVKERFYSRTKRINMEIDFLNK